MEKKEYRPVSMRERDARQAKKFNQYVEGIEKYQARLLKLLAKNEAEDQNYSSAQQKKIQSDLSVLTMVTNCHTFQSIQASDCVEDKELVFKEIQHIRESTKSSIEALNTENTLLKERIKVFEQDKNNKQAVKGWLTGKSKLVLTVGGVITVSGATIAYLKGLLGG